MSHERVELDYGVLVRELEAGLDAFVQGFPLDSFRKGDYKQYPVITLLACSDSRVPGNMVGNMFNRVFTVENIGNQVKTGEGSILYGLLHLGTPFMIVSGHSDCGAIKAASSDFSGEPEALRKELETVQQSLNQGQAGMMGNLSNDDKLKFTQLAELNVDVQIEYLLSYPEIKELVEGKHLYILGTMLDLHDVYGGGYARTYLSNVNGEKNPDLIKGYAELGSIASKAKRIS
ncbi:MAG: carbonic anhydrase [Syntrophomonadaceae bacterium]|nr:carbonic anhydrase [Syntrophomonadaceae bacterium]